MSPLEHFIDLFRQGTDLATDDAARCFDAMQRETDEQVLFDVLSAWNEKGSTTEEIYALATLMRSRAKIVRSVHNAFVDIVGTGGSRSKTFNVSTAAAFVIAGAGLPVAKHGNRAASSRSGSADVLEELGVQIATEPATAEHCLNEIGICFMYAPMFHDLSPLLGKVRRRIGSPTIFNNLGPLSNPSGAPYQLLGVSRREMFDKTAAACSRLGTNRTWIVHAEGDMDEISSSGPTSVAQVSHETVRFFELTPENFGFKRSAVERAGSMTPTDSARYIGEILNNRRTDDEAENLVLINAAAALRLAGIADSLPAAVDIARESLRSGGAAVKLAELVKESNR